MDPNSTGRERLPGDVPAAVPPETPAPVATPPPEPKPPTRPGLPGASRFRPNGRGGAALGFDEAVALTALSAPDVTIDVDLHVGTAEATVWTCDLTYDYVRINGEYRS